MLSNNQTSSLIHKHMIKNEKVSTTLITCKARVNRYAAQQSVPGREARCVIRGKGENVGR